MKCQVLPKSCRGTARPSARLAAPRCLLLCSCVTTTTTADDAVAGLTMMLVSCVQNCGLCYAKLKRKPTKHTHTHTPTLAHTQDKEKNVTGKEPPHTFGPHHGPHPLHTHACPARCCLPLAHLTPHHTRAPLHRAICCRPPIF